MLSLANSDTNSCVLYLENYLDCIDNLPDDLQRHLTKMRELDVSYQDLLHDIETLASQYVESISRGKSDEKVRLLTKIQSTLILAQELGDAKLQIVQQLQDLIENKTRSLDNDYRNIDNGSKEKDVVINSGSISSCVSNNAINANNSINDVTFKEQITISAPASSSSNGSIEQRTSKRVRRVRGETDSNNEHNSTSQHHHHHHYSEHGGSIPMPRVNATLIINNQKKHNNNVSTTKKKKRQKKQGQRNSMQKEDNRSSRTAASNNDDDDDDLSVDPDEPTYCLCDQVSYGEMICCDNDLCPIEWFHFSCVSLNHKPKGKWFCPKCRGDRPNVKKPKAQLEKELERYNREKEETARSH